MCIYSTNRVNNSSRRWSAGFDPNTKDPQGNARRDYIELAINTLPVVCIFDAYWVRDQCNTQPNDPLVPPIWYINADASLIRRPFPQSNIQPIPPTTIRPNGFELNECLAFALLASMRRKDQHNAIGDQQWPVNVVGGWLVMYTF